MFLVFYFRCWCFIWLFTCSIYFVKFILSEIFWIGDVKKLLSNGFLPLLNFEEFRGKFLTSLEIWSKIICFLSFSTLKFFDLELWILYLLSLEEKLFSFWNELCAIILKFCENLTEFLSTSSRLLLYPLFFLSF